MTFTRKNLDLEKEAKKHVYEMLKKWDCEIEDLAIPESLSLKEFPPHQKKILSQWKAPKAGDAHILRMKTKEFYIAEIKGKWEDRNKCIVNQNEYTELWRYKQCGAPILYFVWIKENNKIYVHEITDPKDFDTDYISRKDVYLIPQYKIREIHPKEDTAIRNFITD